MHEITIARHTAHAWMEVKLLRPPEPTILLTVSPGLGGAVMEARLSPVEAGWLAKTLAGVAARTGVPACDTCGRVGDVRPEYRRDESLQAECARLRRMVEAVRDVHRPYPIYELCGHDESDAACVDPIELDDGTWTCGPLVAVVCAACCVDVRGRQTDECAEDHDHGDGLPLCLTIAALAGTGGER